MASYTENLELLMKDPVADGADTFNIETMLNDNWKKIDDAVGKLNYDPAGAASAAVSAHNTDPQAHPAMRAMMLTAQVQVSYNEGV